MMYLSTIYKSKYLTSTCIQYILWVLGTLVFGQPYLTPTLVTIETVGIAPDTAIGPNLEKQWALSHNIYLKVDNS